MLFDVIVGNPPYQGAKSKDTKKGKPPTIWHKFVEVLNGYLKPDGVMVMVHPAMYRKPGNPLQSVLYHNNRQLHMYNNAEAMVTFKASTRYDWYVIDKTYTGPTEVTFEDTSTHKIDISKLTFLPNGSWTIWDKCADLVTQHGDLKAIKDPTRVTGKGPYPVVQTVTTTKGVVLQQTSVSPKYLTDKKVIIAESGRYIGYYDDGQYAMGSNCYHIPVSGQDEGDTIVNFIKSKLGINLVESCKWGNFRTERVVWEHIPNVYEMGLTPTSTDADIYQAFGLSDQEIKFVESFRYGTRRSVL